MYETMLEAIERKAQSFGETFRPPLDAKGLSRLQQRVRDELGTELPPEYAHFLGRFDGLDWDGLKLYASEEVPPGRTSQAWVFGLVEANLRYRAFEPMKQYLLLGEDGLDFFVHQPANGTFAARSMTTLDLSQEVPTFDALMLIALEHRLH